MYVFSVGIPLGGALGAASGKGWAGVGYGILAGVIGGTMYGLAFAGGEAVLRRLPEKARRILTRKVLPGESFISTGPLGGDSQSGRD